MSSGTVSVVSVLVLISGSVPLRALVARNNNSDDITAKIGPADRFIRCLCSAFGRVAQPGCIFSNSRGCQGKTNRILGTRRDLTSVNHRLFLLPNVKKLFSAFLVAAAALAPFAMDASAGVTQPAMVGSRHDSFASQLHFPQSARAARKQAAVTFYCEIASDGK